MRLDRMLLFGALIAAALLVALPGSALAIGPTPIALDAPDNGNTPLIAYAR